MLLGHCSMRSIASGTWNRAVTPLAATSQRSTRTASSPRRQQQHELLLAPGEVHVWWLHSDLVPDTQLQHALQQLPHAEQAYVRESPDAAVQRQRTLARSFLRATLSLYLPHTSPGQLRFLKNEHGKPFLLPESAAAAAETQQIAASLQFNLSHTASLLGCAVCLHHHIGLDVELKQRHQLGSASGSSSSSSSGDEDGSSSDDGSSSSSRSSSKSRRDVRRLARRRFSAEEVQQLEAAPDAVAREQLFMALWTLKEAVVKARGTGIYAPPGLKGFSIGLSADFLHQQQQHQQKQQQLAAISLSHCFSEGQDQQQYRLLLCCPSDHHFAAICVRQQQQQQQQQQPLRLAVAAHTSLKTISSSSSSDSSARDGSDFQVLAASGGWDLSSLLADSRR